eukprot:scaffold584_cov338-Pavlova_lutheri.AAC.23
MIPAFRRRVVLTLAHLLPQNRCRHVWLHVQPLQGKGNVSVQFGESLLSSNILEAFDMHAENGLQFADGHLLDRCLWPVAPVAKDFCKVQLSGFAAPLPCPGFETDGRRSNEISRHGSKFVEVSLHSPHVTSDRKTPEKHFVMMEDSPPKANGCQLALSCECGLPGKHGEWYPVPFSRKESMPLPSPSTIAALAFLEWVDAP